MHWRLLAVAVLAGCTFDGSVEGEANITCGETSDCPSGFFCQASVGRCIRLLSPGLAPPGLLGPVVVTPTLAARDVTIRVVFQVSEPLASPPAVRAVYVTGASVTVPLVDENLESGNYVAALRPAADAPEGAVRFFVDLLDVDGAQARDLELGTSVLDRQPPAVVRGSATLTLTPSSTNPLSRVEAMNETTLAQLTFSVTEPLAVAPALSASVGGDAQAFSARYGSATGTSHLFWLTLASAAVPQGVATLALELEDLAGNRATVDLELKAPGLVVDTQAPTLTGLGDGGVQLLRAPTGAAFRLGTRGTSVFGRAGVTEPGTVLVASETPTSADLARTTASATGEFELALPADFPSVTVRALDAAGNQSAPTLVQQVSWFASLSGSSPGAGATHPHRAFSTRVLGPTPEPWGQLEHFGSSGLDAIGGGVVVTQGGLNWRRVPGDALLNPGVQPPGENGVVATWDPFRARAVLLSSGPAVWEWNGAGWRTISPTDPEGDGNPPSGWQFQSRGGIAFDEDLRLVLVVTMSGATWETWGWNGVSWLRLARETTSRCTGCALTWDSRRRRVLLFDPPTGTTAAWDSGARTWQVLTVATSPTLQAVAPAMAFEHHTGRWVRFGGWPTHDETWVFDGDAWSLAADGEPSPRWGAVMGYDSLRGRILLHGGGVDEGGATLGDTWEWNGTRWRALADAGPVRRQGSLVAAPALDEVLLVAGGGTLRLAADGGFVPTAGGALIEARTGLSTTYSAFHDALLFAGGVNDAGVLRNQVHGLGPGGFFSLPALPLAHQRGALAADPATGRLFYVGGLGADGGPSAVTLMTSDSGTWLTLDAGRRLPDGGTSPAPRSDPIAFFEPQRGALVMIGGRGVTSASSESFTLGPTGWVDGGLPEMTQAEGCLWGGAAAQAPDGGTFVFSGFGYGAGQVSWCQNLVSSSTSARFWFVTGGAATPLSLPGITRGFSPLSWDEGVSAWVFFGGAIWDHNAVTDDVLRAAWTNQWTDVPFVVDTDGDGSPGRRTRHAFGYIKELGRLRLYGGENNGQPLNDAWELTLAGSRPALLFRVQLQGASPRGATPLALRVEGVAGADEVDGGRPGIGVRVWHRQRWLELDPAAPDGGVALATTQQPGPFFAELRDPTVLADLLLEPTLTLAIVPRFGFWRAPPLVSVDYLELRLDSAFTGTTP